MEDTNPPIDESCKTIIKENEEISKSAEPTEASGVNEDADAAAASAMFDEFEGFDEAFEEFEKEVDGEPRPTEESPPPLTEESPPPAEETTAIENDDLPHEDSEILIKPKSKKKTRKSKAENDLEKEQKKQDREKRKEERERSKEEVKRRKEEVSQRKQLEKDRSEAMKACQRELRDSAVKIKDVFGAGGKKSQEKAKQWFDSCCEDPTLSQSGLVSVGSFSGTSPTQAPPRLARITSMIRMTQDETDLGPQEILDDDSNDSDLVLDIIDDEEQTDNTQPQQDEEAAQLREQQLIERRHELMKFQTSNSIKFDIEVDDSQSQSVMDILERSNSMGYGNSFIRSRKSMIKTNSFASKDFAALRARSGKDNSSTVMFKGDSSKSSQSAQQNTKLSQPGANKVWLLLFS